MYANPTLIPIATVLLGALPAFSAAAEPVRHAGRNITYPKSVEITEKDESTKRTAGRFERGGLTFHTEGPRTGEVSMIVITGTFDFTGGFGSYQAEVLRTFENGETVTVAIDGETRREEGTRISLGTYRCVDGTGSLKGVSCEGSYTSKPFENRMSIVDWEGTATAPGS